MRCTRCGGDNREGRKFCSKSGGPLACVCPKCSGLNEPGDDFCGECGAQLGPSTAAPANKSHPAAASEIRIAPKASSASLDGERKTITALFADIKGSTELERDLDPSDCRSRLKLMIDAVRRYDCYVMRSTGDGIFALFGAPLPMRTIRSARFMQLFGCRMSCGGPPHTNPFRVLG
jgi:Double zinc ribbon